MGAEEVAMRALSVSSAVILMFSALWLGSCDGGAPLCTPGASSACVCSDGASGAQVCNSEGSGYDACLCSESSRQAAAAGEDQGSASPDAEASDTGERRASGAPEGVSAGEWSAVEPGGQTICARGTPFRFFVHGGDPSRVVIDFLGGGACWDAFSCEVGQEIQGQTIFTDAAGTLEELKASHEAGLLGGLYDFEHPDNPYQGWTVIRVPYCTGDFYWGDVTVDYGEDLTIHHRGFVNAQSVTAWVTANYPDATQVVSTGCEAGAYGSLNQALSLADAYPDAIVTALGDSGAGVITDSFFADAFMTWNAFASMPLHLEGLAGKPLEDIRVTDFVIAASQSPTGLRVAQYLTAYDVVQSYHYLFMGGDITQWNTLAVSSLTHIRARADNFRYYLAPGPIHCITPFDITYEREVNGVPYAKWVKAIIGSDALPDDVSCHDPCPEEDESCEDPCADDPICQGCTEGSIESVACQWCENW